MGQDARGTVVTGTGVLLFSSNGAATTTWHRQPALKFVAATNGTLHWRWRDAAGLHAGRGSGVLVPPEVVHHLHVSGLHDALFVEPWIDAVPRVTTPRALSDRSSQELTTAIRRHTLDPMEPEDLDRSTRTLMTSLTSDLALPRRGRLRDEVRTAAGNAAEAPSLAALADQVALSPSRLRELIRTDTGTSLARLRAWQRLCIAADSNCTSWAERAVAAGFSDQAHMTRTARSLTGRTPADALAVRPFPA